MSLVENSSIATSYIDDNDDDEDDDDCDRCPPCEWPSSPKLLVPAIDILYLDTNIMIIIKMIILMMMMLMMIIMMMTLSNDTIK